MPKLSNKILLVNDRRTSMRLSKGEWDAIDEICQDAKMSRNALIELIENHNKNLGLTCSTRMVALAYFRALAQTNRKVAKINIEKMDRFINKLLS